MFRGRDEFIAAARRFVEGGVEAGEPTLVAVAPERLDDLRHALAAPSGQVRLEDADEVARNPARLLELAAEWAEQGSGPVRLLAEPIPPRRSDAEIVEGARHEALINLALAGCALTVLCPYDLEQLESPAIEWALRTHERILTADGSASQSPCFEADPNLLAPGEWPLGAAADGACEREFGADLSALRRLVGDSGCGRALPVPRRDDFVLALNEVAENVVKHGGGDGMLRLWREPASVIAEVRGPAQIDDPLVGHRRPDPSALGGRGLWLVNQLCDLVQLRSEDGVTTVRIHMRTGA